MKHQALIIAHSDGDGHIIAEQVRRNLSLIDIFDIQVVVDPDKTKDHKSWRKLDTIKEIENAGFVFFLDLMFAPATFDEEAKSLVDFVQGRPEKIFFLIDHHPLPLRRLERAKNLRVMYRPDVSELHRPAIRNDDCRRALRTANRRSGGHEKTDTRNAGHRSAPGRRAGRVATR